MDEENVPLIITPYMSGGSLSNKLKTQVFEKTKIMYSKISGNSITNSATILRRNGAWTSIPASAKICALRFGRAKLHVRNYYLYYLCYYYHQNNCMTVVVEFYKKSYYFLKLIQLSEYICLYGLA